MLGAAQPGSQCSQEGVPPSQCDHAPCCPQGVGPQARRLPRPGARRARVAVVRADAGVPPRGRHAPRRGGPRPVAQCRPGGPAGALGGELGDRGPLPAGAEAIPRRLRHGGVPARGPEGGPRLGAHVRGPRPGALPGAAARRAPRLPGGPARAAGRPAAAATAAQVHGAGGRGRGCGALWPGPRAPGARRPRGSGAAAAGAVRTLEGGSAEGASAARHRRAGLRRERSGGGPRGRGAAGPGQLCSGAGGPEHGAAEGFGWWPDPGGLERVRRSLGAVPPVNGGGSCGSPGVMLRGYRPCAATSQRRWAI
mmetsp:Transcript_14580/g.38536  ORF Transcript_14580/g.38536 Transcript_14580/m.38536 type:complete len:309 (-) Transcript_14580:367-1293(-)